MSVLKIRGLAAALAPLRELVAQEHLAGLASLWGRPRSVGVAVQPLPPAPPDLFPPRGQLLYDLLYRGEPVERALAEAALGSAGLRQLLKVHLLRADGGRLRANGALLHCAAGFHFFAGALQLGPGRPEVVVHFGFDSLCLADAVQCHGPVERALDLCSGGGLQALCLSRSARHVTAVEIVEEVAAVAAVNFGLARVGARIEQRIGDLFEDLGGAQFDLIVCNPPFAPGSTSPERDRAGAAGLDGLGVVRQVLQLAPAHLRPGGRLLMVMGMFGDAEGPAVAEEFRQIALANRWQIRCFAVLQPMPFAEVAVPGLIAADDLEARSQERARAAKALGVTHYHFGLLAAQESKKPGFCYVKASPAAGPGSFAR